MLRTRWLCLFVLAWLGLSATAARAFEKDVPVNARIKGRVVDHTSNHGKDNRIWARSLFQKRDLYVYLPPGYCKEQQYPIMIFMHGFAQDEQSLLAIVPYIDAAIACGKLPPLVIASPDGSLDGKGCLDKPGSFFLNSNAGPYEDFVLQDVWDFVTQNYSIRPEREAHILAGVSMGGFAAFNLGIRHRKAFGIAIGVHPPLNLRWADSDGNPKAAFDPRKWGWRQGYDNPREVVACIGPVKIRLGDVIQPAFGVGDEALLAITQNNPIEMLDRCKLRNGELSMFVGYGNRDEFNVDAQVESFLYYAKFRGIGLHVANDPGGRHDEATAIRFIPSIVRWLAPQLAPYGTANGCGTKVCR